MASPTPPATTQSRNSVTHGSEPTNIRGSTSDPSRERSACVASRSRSMSVDRSSAAGTSIGLGQLIPRRLLPIGVEQLEPSSSISASDSAWLLSDLADLFVFLADLVLGHLQHAVGQPDGVLELLAGFLARWACARGRFSAGPVRWACWASSSSEAYSASMLVRRPHPSA